jgi:hypothetical protein
MMMMMVMMVMMMMDVQRGVCVEEARALCYLALCWLLQSQERKV